MKDGGGEIEIEGEGSGNDSSIDQTGDVLDTPVEGERAFDLRGSEGTVKGVAVANGSRDGGRGWWRGIRGRRSRDRSMRDFRG